MQSVWSNAHEIFSYYIPCNNYRTVNQVENGANEIKILLGQT